MPQTALSGVAQFSDTTSEVNRIEFITTQVLNRMATATLVQVKAVDTDTVDVQPMVAQVDGSGNAIPHGVIHNVPVFTLRAGASAILLTPEVGDIGLAIFCHNDISSAKRNKAPSNPGSRRRFDWADALYLGGFFGPTPTQYVRLNGDGIAIRAVDGKPISLTSTDEISAAGAVATDTEYRVAGIKVVGEQQPAITSPTGGTTVDSASRTAIGSIISVLRDHGLIAS